MEERVPSNRVGSFQNWRVRGSTDIYVRTRRGANDSPGDEMGVLASPAAMATLCDNRVPL